MQHSSAAAVQKFISSTAIAPAAQRWMQMITVQDLWSNTANEYELYVGNIEEIEQQLQLAEPVNTANKKCNFCLSKFPRVE